VISAAAQSVAKSSTSETVETMGAHYPHVAPCLFDGVTDGLDLGGNKRLMVTVEPEALIPNAGFSSVGRVRRGQAYRCQHQSFE